MKSFAYRLSLVSLIITLGIGCGVGCEIIHNLTSSKATPAQKADALAKSLTAANDTFAVMVQDKVITDPKVIVAYNAEQADILAGIHSLEIYAQTGDDAAFTDLYPKLLGKLTEMLARYAVPHKATTRTAA